MWRCHLRHSVLFIILVFARTVVVAVPHSSTTATKTTTATTTTAASLASATTSAFVASISSSTTTSTATSTSSTETSSKEASSSTSVPHLRSLPLLEAVANGGGGEGSDSSGSVKRNDKKDDEEAFFVDFEEMGEMNGMATTSTMMLNGGSMAESNGGMAESNGGMAGAPGAGRLEALKAQEARLLEELNRIRQEKVSTLKSRPLTIGVIGFGRFGQFIARTFGKYARVIVTSRSDYTDIANGMGVTYVPLSDPAAFLKCNLDVIVVAVSILSFEGTVRNLVPHLRAQLNSHQGATPTQGPLVVDVLSVKEHARQVLLELLPPECDILCTHPMFGPDSGKDGWHGLNFVYERTRVDGVVLDDKNGENFSADGRDSTPSASATRTQAKDRVERFLSIWEEEGCRMVEMTCAHHDAFAANSQFITHLMGRILGQQGLSPTPIDTRGFESVLKLIGSTTADSFDLFYGLYKYNSNSIDTIVKLKSALDDVVTNLSEMEQKDTNAPVRHDGQTLTSLGVKAQQGSSTETGHCLGTTTATPSGPLCKNDNVLLEGGPTSAAG